MKVLQRPPKGYDKEHPLIADLKRKDFIVTRNLDEKTAASAGFVDEVTNHFVVAKPLMQFLCKALELQF